MNANKSMTEIAKEAREDALVKIGELIATYRFTPEEVATAEAAFHETFSTCDSAHRIGPEFDRCPKDIES